MNTAMLDRPALVTARLDEALALSPFQQRVCAVPEAFNLFLGGGRSGAKSHAMAFLALRHAAQYGDRARMLYLRQTYKGLRDFEQVTRDLASSGFASVGRSQGTQEDCGRHSARSCAAPALAVRRWAQPATMGFRIGISEAHQEREHEVWPCDPNTRQLAFC